MLHSARPGSEWWRSGVIYQIYPRSFADQNGDGMGDLPGITSRLPKLKELGVDAIWLSPFYTSPQKDAGYDVADYRGVDPLFGTLEDFDAMVAKAHELGLRVMIDLVPNHSSDQHEWFQKALAAGPGSKEREYYHFKAGRGENGELPPNNWQSMFGGPAWTRVSDGEWYVHLFDSSQPDLNWENPVVRAELGLKRARAATTMMLALPGGAYIYQGEELGLPEHTTIDGNFRQDPTYFRTKGERVGRDGCRVPIPWEAGAPAFGFSPTGESWLPQPDLYKSYARDLQEGVKGSTLELYKSLLANRKSLNLGLGELKWVEKYCSANSLGYQNGEVLVIANFDGAPIELPTGEVLVSTQADASAKVLEKDQAVWIKL